METRIFILVTIVVFITLCFFILNSKRESFVEEYDDIERSEDFHSEKRNVGKMVENVEKKKGKKKKKNKKGINIEKQIVSTPNVIVDEPIVIHDTVRRDSKVDSSLEFTYLDEQCQKIKVQNAFPIQSVEVNDQAPIVPLVNNKCMNRVEKLKKPCKNRDVEYMKMKMKRDKERIERINNSEMFDDSDLKPKPNIDSPYGFVYFPNKYWSAWQKKAPVCIPAGNKCKVLPTYTQGTPVDVLDYTQIGSMMPKFNYSEEYEDTEIEVKN